MVNTSTILVHGFCATLPLPCAVLAPQACPQFRPSRAGSACFVTELLEPLTSTGKPTHIDLYKSGVARPRTHIDLYKSGAARPRTHIDLYKSGWPDPEPISIYINPGWPDPEPISIYINLGWPDPEPI